MSARFEREPGNGNLDRFAKITTDTLFGNGAGEPASGIKRVCNV
jgi:hypothetical protein